MRSCQRPTDHRRNLRLLLTLPVLCVCERRKKLQEEDEARERLQTHSNIVSFPLTTRLWAHRTAAADSLSEPHTQSRVEASFLCFQAAELSVEELQLEKKETEVEVGHRPLSRLVIHLETHLHCVLVCVCVLRRLRPSSLSARGTLESSSSRRRRQ